MRANLISAVMSVAALLLAQVFAPSARGDDEQVHKLGDHPAVVVQRLHKAAGYDYASKFYPHPAWLRLYAEQPHDEAEVAVSAGGASKSDLMQLSVAREKELPAPNRAQR